MTWSRKIQQESQWSVSVPQSTINDNKLANWACLLFARIDVRSIQPTTHYVIQERIPEYEDFTHFGTLVIQQRVWMNWKLTVYNQANHVLPGSLHLRYRYENAISFSRLPFKLLVLLSVWLCLRSFVCLLAISCISAAALNCQRFQLHN